MWSAHRLSYAIHTGPVDGIQICHTCDNPPCVNPKHLFAGSAKTNSNDKMLKGRHQFNLTNDEVLEIRSRPKTSSIVREVAEEFGMSTTTATKLLEGEIYSWLPGGETLPKQFRANKFSKKDIEYILSEIATGRWGVQARLAKEFGVNPSTISHIKHGRVGYTDTQ